MPLDFNQIVSATMVLFAVIDILGSIPIIISLRQRLGHIEAEKASIAATAIMVAFLFIGERLLFFLGVDVNSFAVAGSFVLFFLALEMILGVRLYKEEVPKAASIVPIAFPLVAGAGTMTTLVSLRAEYHAINILVAIAINMILVFIVLKNSSRIENVLGPGGLGILRKIFGVILLAISVKLFATNIKFLF